MATDMDMLTTAKALVQVFHAGTMPKLLCFWRPVPAEVGTLGVECMSQWHASSFEIDGVGYKTAEHWMMAEKARLFDDESKRQEVIECSHPGEAQRLGRDVRDFSQGVWERERSEIVTVGNVAKFGQNTELGEFLAASAARVLVEASPRDRIWGIGLEASDRRTADPSQWRGLNLLGFALMEARRRLAR